MNHRKPPQNASAEKKLQRSKRAEEQHILEGMIIRYQEFLKSGTAQQTQAEFDRICKVYNPKNYMSEWSKLYAHLYDDKDDFESDYMKVFCAVLKGWTPRDVRKASKYGGSGEFKNFFWGALQNHYINLVKAMASGKRNASICCPICGLWCNSLSTHVLQFHHDLLWDHMKHEGFNLSEKKDCPFCDNHRSPTKCTVLDNDNIEDALQAKQTAALKKHILSKHSSLLFDIFHTSYPQYNASFVKPSSVYHVEDDHEGNLYDTLSVDSPLSQLLDSGLSLLQQQIVINALNGNGVEYNRDYQCSAEEFEHALCDLKDSMNLFGMQGD